MVRESSCHREGTWAQPPLSGIQIVLYLTLHLSEGKQQSGQRLRLDSVDTSHHFQEMTNVPQTATLIQQFQYID